MAWNDSNDYDEDEGFLQRLSASSPSFMMMHQSDQDTVVTIKMANNHHDDDDSSCSAPNDESDREDDDDHVLANKRTRDTDGDELNSSSSSSSQKRRKVRKEPLQLRFTAEQDDLKLVEKLLEDVDNDRRTSEEDQSNTFVFSEEEEDTSLTGNSSREPSTSQDLENISTTSQVLSEGDIIGVNFLPHTTEDELGDEYFSEFATSPLVRLGSKADEEEERASLALAFALAQDEIREDDEKQAVLLSAAAEVSLNSSHEGDKNDFYQDESVSATREQQHLMPGNSPPHHRIDTEDMLDGDDDGMDGIVDHDLGISTVTPDIPPQDSIPEAIVTRQEHSTTVPHQSDIPPEEDDERGGGMKPAAIPDHDDEKDQKKPAAFVPQRENLIPDHNEEQEETRGTATAALPVDVLPEAQLDEIIDDSSAVPAPATMAIRLDVIQNGVDSQKNAAAIVTPMLSVDQQADAMDDASLANHLQGGVTEVASTIGHQQQQQANGMDEIFTTTRQQHQDGSTIEEQVEDKPPSIVSPAMTLEDDTQDAHVASSVTDLPAFIHPEDAQNQEGNTAEDNVPAKENAAHDPKPSESGNNGAAVVDNDLPRDETQAKSAADVVANHMQSTHEDTEEVGAAQELAGSLAGERQDGPTQDDQVDQEGAFRSALQEWTVHGRAMVRASGPLSPHNFVECREIPRPLKLVSLLWNDGKKDTYRVGVASQDEGTLHIWTNGKRDHDVVQILDSDAKFQIRDDLYPGAECYDTVKKQWCTLKKVNLETGGVLVVFHDKLGTVTKPDLISPDNLVGSTAYIDMAASDAVAASEAGGECDDSSAEFKDFLAQQAMAVREAYPDQGELDEVEVPSASRKKEWVDCNTTEVSLKGAVPVGETTPRRS